jgi:two-component system sensor histidine kinase KdpD
VIHYAHENNCTHIVVSTAQRSWWRELLRSSATHDIIRRAGDISVHVVPEQLTRAMKGPAQKPALAPAQAGAALNYRAYLGSAGMVAVALAVGQFLSRFGITNVALVFLTAVLASAITYGLWPSLFACVVAMLAYNFFFMPPFYTFTIADPDNVVALFFFMVIAFIASYISSRMRAQAIVTRERAAMTENLYLFSRKIASVYTLDDLLWATSYQIAQMLKVRVVMLLPDGDSVAVRAGYPPEDTLDDADVAAAKWVWQHGTPAGRGADTLPGADRFFLPLRTGRGTVAVIGLDSDRPGPLLTPDQHRLFDALADQAALAIERINFAEDIDRARLSAETERLRGALLTSISHDLRTPLSGILGAATALKGQRTSLNSDAQEELVATIQEESERLNRFITNLLDMTRLESGALAPRWDSVDLGDVIGSALRRSSKVLARHRVELDLAPDMPALQLDSVLFEQVLFNLLDNAAKYSPAGSEVRLCAAMEDNHVKIEIADEGDGIPDADLERIFDKFYRVYAADSKTGTGLGLPICRGFVEAMGGTIRAGNRSDKRGARFTITLPLPVQAPREQAA